MKTTQDIEKELIESYVSLNDDVTYFGIGGVLRGLFSSIAIKMRELWYDLTATKRKLFLDTCIGSDLDDYGKELNIPRSQGKKAGTMLVFTGTANTVVPKGTVVSNPTTNLTYTTVQAITIGAKNPNLKVSGDYSLANIMLGDSCWAECNSIGTKGNSAPNTITKCEISGVSGVTNPLPAQGGTDIESDENYRYKLRNCIKLLNNNTISFYETLCTTLNDNVMRARAYKDYSKPDAINIVVVSKSGSDLDEVSLRSIVGQINNNQRAFSYIDCKNVDFTSVFIDIRVRLNSGYTLSEYFLTVTDALSQYFDWSKWEWGKSIQTDNVAKQILNIPATKELDLSSFKVNNSLASSVNLKNKLSLPYFAGLKITDIDNPSEPKSNYTIKESYENYIIYNTNIIGE